MPVLFGKRAVTGRPTVSPYSAQVDTTGMDPEMKSTFGSMRGPAASVGGSDPFAGIKNLYKSTVNWIGSMSHGGRNNGAPVPPPPENKSYN